MTFMGLQVEAPAAMRAASLYHLWMDTAFKARNEGTFEHPVTRLFLDAILHERDFVLCYGRLSR
jgi:hypothetical protein